jgi:hypothetical protein
VSGNFVNGVWSGNVTVMSINGNSSNKVLNVVNSANSSHTGSSNSFTVNPGSLDHFSMSSVSSPQTAGAPFNITITAQDANNNTVTSFGSTVSISDNTGTISPTTSGSFSSGVRTEGVIITKAQSGVMITVSGSGKLGQSNSFTVNPAALDHFVVTNTSSGNIGTQTAGLAFNIRIEARDAFNNIVTSHTGGGSAVTISLNSGTINPTTSGNFSNGVLASQSVTITTAGNDKQINVSGGSPTRTGSSNLFNVLSSSVQSFTVSTISSPQTAGAQFLVTITAKDGPGGTGNTATDFTATVNLSLNSGTLTPSVSGNFTSGVWTGNITVQNLAGSSTGKILNANDGAGHTGASNSFTVNPGAPAGTVTLTPTPNTLPADGVSTSQITSTTIFDSFGNDVGAGKLFTVTLTPSNLGTIVDPDADSGTPGHQVATIGGLLDFDFQAGTTGGTVNIVVSSVGGTATGSTTIAIGSMVITSISTTPQFVSRGQTGITVQMVVQNLSPSQITNLSASLTFTGTVDRTGEYTQSRSDGFTTIPAQGSRTLAFNVGVSSTASLEVITIDGQVTGQIGPTPVSAAGAAIKDSWTVQVAALLTAISVTSTEDTVVVGQQGNPVTVRISNPAPAGAAAAVIDSVRLKFFKDGVTDRSSDFSFSASGGNPPSVPAGQQLDFSFTVGAGGSTESGDYEIDARVFGHDANSTTLPLQDLAAGSRHDWFVKDAPALQILSLTTSPGNTFIASQTTPWTVKMALRNNGPDPIDLDFSVAKTFIRFVIGVDVTSQYTITQPTRLVIAPNNRLNSGATDTLDFRITKTGTTLGIATIIGRVEGIDTGTGNPIFDDTNDGGTGVVTIISSSAKVFILLTRPDVFNSSQGIGFVNISQPFGVEVTVKNDLGEGVQNVQINLTKDGQSTITTNPVTIPSIGSGATGVANFALTAAGSVNPTGETFTARILSATGQQTQTPASIGTPADSLAVVRIQTRASLVVQFTVLNPFQTASDIFDVQATVTNLGQAQVGTSGTLRLSIPAGYTLFSGSPIQSFIVGVPVQWQVTAPAAATTAENFTVEIFQIPQDLNTAAPAHVQTQSDTRAVQTLATELDIDSFAIIAPAGATDAIVSTDQRFDLQAGLTVSENIDSVRADLSLPVGYALVSGFTSSRLLTPGQETVLWRVVTPALAHQTPRTFQARMRGYDDGQVRVDTTALLNVVTMAKANLLFEHFNSNPSEGVQVSVDQEFQLQALIRNIGQAGVEGPATVTLNLANTGITSVEPLTQTFIPDNTVIWNVRAPSSASPSQSISVTISATPNDENTNETASAQPLVRTILIETVESGNIRIDDVFVSTPTGAQDGSLSTEQQFTIEAEISWSELTQLQAEIVFPPFTDYQVLDNNGSRFRDIIQGPSTSVSWTLSAPTTAFQTPHFIKIRAQGRDVNNTSVVIIAQPDSLPFTVVRKAELELLADISSPESATDNILTVGQKFTVTAELRNNGDAALIGNDKLEIRLPLGYTTADSAIQTILPNDRLVSWEIIAPNLPTGIQAITVEMESRTAKDENTNAFPDLTPIPTQVIIPVSTRGIALEATILTDRRRAQIARGETDVPIFGILFENESDDSLVVEGINMRVSEKGNDIAPNSVFSRMMVVNYNNPTTIFRDVTPPPTANPVVFDFNPAIAVPPNQARAIEFRVDVQPQTEVGSFQLSIPSPQVDIAARVVESDSLVEIVDANGQPITAALSPGPTALFDPGLQGSFFNYPNPFGHSQAPTTLLQYQLAQDSDVSIRIYTLLGELVWSISFQATDPEGRGSNTPHTVVWDGKNDRGQNVLNGVYVAVINSNAGKAMTKIAVAR